MEKRKITVIPTKTHKTQVIESAATTLAELKADLTKAGIDYTDCTFFEGLTKIELKNDAAILPHDVPYKGTTTNNLVFMITNASKKIRSGVKLDRKAIIEEIKSKNLTELVKKTYGKNYTNCKTEDLEKILNKEAASTTIDALAPVAKVAPAKKETVEIKSNTSVFDNTEYITKTQLTKILTFILDKMDDVEYFSNINLDNCPYLRDNVVKKETSESPYSSNELDDMFKDM